jgi:hypothetical protein
MLISGVNQKRIKVKPPRTEIKHTTEKLTRHKYQPCQKRTIPKRKETPKMLKIWCYKLPKTMLKMTP